MHLGQCHWALKDATESKIQKQMETCTECWPSALSMTEHFLTSVTQARNAMACCGHRQLPCNTNLSQAQGGVSTVSHLTQAGEQGSYFSHEAADLCGILHDPVKNISVYSKSSWHREERWPVASCWQGGERAALPDCCACAGDGAVFRLGEPRTLRNSPGNLKGGHFNSTH